MSERLGCPAKVTVLRHDGEVFDAAQFHPGIGTSQRAGVPAARLD